MSRGHGKVQRTILESLQRGPATTRMLQDECWTDERSVRRSLDRLRADGVIRRRPKLLDRGMPVWSMPGDDRELNPDRVLTFVNERVWRQIRRLETEGWRGDDRLEATFFRFRDLLTDREERAIVDLMIDDEMTEDEAREHRAEIWAEVNARVELLKSDERTRGLFPDL